MGTSIPTRRTIRARPARTAYWGTWKSTAVTLSSPNELIIRDLGLDRLEFQVPAMKARADLTLDGKETAVAGPDLPTGLRLSLTRVGPYTLHLVQKLNGTTTSSSMPTPSPRTI